MSNEVEFWLEVKLTKDRRTLRIEISSSTSDKNLEVLAQTIKKAIDKEVDLNPLASFLKDKELNLLIKQGWKIIDLEFILHPDQLLEFIDKQGENGVTSEQLIEPWPHIKINRINGALFNLQLDYLVSPARFVGKIGGYISKKYHDSANHKRLNEDNIKIDPKNESGKIKKSLITKSDGKKYRKNIIDKATKINICEAGFKPEFIETLEDKEKEYFNNLSNLQIKIMRTEVSKKYD